jgi:hypothetical protein
MVMYQLVLISTSQEGPGIPQSVLPGTKDGLREGTDHRPWW